MSSHGPYAIGDCIGRGGYATVHISTDLGHPRRRTVAIKRLRPSVSENPAHRAALAIEATTLGRLDHPNIVKLYDFGYQDGECLLVMEHVDGLSCGRLMRGLERFGSAVPRDAALFIALEVLGALDFVHRSSDDAGGVSGFVHRDISPGNIVLSRNGQVKLIDFGIALDRTSDRPNATRRLLGKIGYLSPEQARGEAVDRRSDLFSLGVVLAEMLLACRLFPGNGPLQVLERIRKGDLTTLALARERVPLELRLILATALDLEPERRFQTAAEFKHALLEYVRHNPHIQPSREALVRCLRDTGALHAKSGTYAAIGIPSLQTSQDSPRAAGGRGSSGDR